MPSTNSPDPSSLSKLLPQPAHDPRYTYRSALLNGHTYSYIHAPPPPNTPHLGTLVLIHGFPDLSFTWRHQIPHLTALGLTIIAPDCLGYGRSDSPPTSSLSSYTYARIAHDISTLCSQLGLTSILLGGHDWGGAIVYRIALLYPTLVRAVFSICTPYDAPKRGYTPLQQLVETKVPNFRYQLHFASGEIERHVRSRGEIASFLNALYGARALAGDDTAVAATAGSGNDGKGKSKRRGESAFTPDGPVRLELLPIMGKSRLLSDREMEFYVTEFERHGVNGPLNWYRTRELNYVDEWKVFFADGTGSDRDKEKVKIRQPTLFVHATRDGALPEWMSRGMDALIPRLTRRKVEAGHWVCWEKPDEVNEILVDWLKGLMRELGMDGKESGAGKSKL